MPLLEDSDQPVESLSAPSCSVNFLRVTGRLGWLEIRLHLKGTGIRRLSASGTDSMPAGKGVSPLATADRTSFRQFVGDLT